MIKAIVLSWSDLIKKIREKDVEFLYLHLNKVA